MIPTSALTPAPNPCPRSGQNRLDPEEGMERDGDSSFAVESAADQTKSCLRLVEPYAIRLAVSQVRVVGSEIREKVPNAYHSPGFSGTASKISDRGAANTGGLRLHSWLLLR
jgi:hypothetical protein